MNNSAFRHDSTTAPQTCVYPPFRKSNLRSGMLVTLRNSESYYVVLNTGFPYADHQGVLVHKVGSETGWMPLVRYDNNLAYHDDPDGIFPPNTPEEDRQWDIVQVSTVHSPADFFIRSRYTVIWEREG